MIKSFVLIAAFALSAFAAPISLSVGFSGGPGFIFTPVAYGDTSVTFSNVVLGFPVCGGPEAALCNAANVVTNSALFDSGGALSTFDLGDVLYGTISSWTVTGAGGNYAIATTGLYFAPGFDPTPGNLNFTFQLPPIGNVLTFSASGQSERQNPIPEPSSMALLGAGLVGLRLLAHRK